MEEQPRSKGAWPRRSVKSPQKNTDGPIHIVYISRSSGACNSGKGSGRGNTQACSPALHPNLAQKPHNWSTLFHKDHDFGATGESMDAGSREESYDLAPVGSAGPKDLYQQAGPVTLRVEPRLNVPSLCPVVRTQTWDPDHPRVSVTPATHWPNLWKVVFLTNSECHPNSTTWKCLRVERFPHQNVLGLLQGLALTLTCSFHSICPLWRTRRTWGLRPRHRKLSTGGIRDQTSWWSADPSPSAQSSNFPPSLWPSPSSLCLGVMSSNSGSGPPPFWPLVRASVGQLDLWGGAPAWAQVQ